MKVIIAGSRDFNDIGRVALACEEFEKTHGKITQVVSGGCRGADRLGELWAQDRHIPTVKFWADWDAFGKAAGPIRNGIMASNADALIAFPNGRSGGTQDMIRKAQAKGLLVVIHQIETTPGTRHHKQ